ncbi:MAG: ATP-binding protein [Gammaproteobacteria bacterium]|nr:ATP-binding protein [Gammaproteobacteria bacterium]
MYEILESDLKKSLASDNPWWNNGSDPLTVGLRQRAYFKAFKTLSLNWEVNRSVILMGPRRVGKTVMLHQLIQHALEDGFSADSILFASLDTPLYGGIAPYRLVEIFEELKPHDPHSRRLIIFDEIQYLKGWEVHLKNLTDRFPKTRFIASGSAAAALRLKSNESGAGRFTDFFLPSLSFSEYLNFKNLENDLIDQVETGSQYCYSAKDIEKLNHEFVHYLNYGNYPEAVLNQAIRKNPSRYLGRDLIDRILLRDLPSLYGIENIQELNKLFTTIAYHSGKEFSLNGLASGSGVSTHTIKRYLEYLEAAFLIMRINRIDDDGTSFVRNRQFKLHLTSPSMRTALFSSLEGEDEAMGHMTETAIFSQWSHSDIAGKLHYAKWKKGRQFREVDLVIRASYSWGRLPVETTEIKWSDRFISRPAELKGLIEFAQRNCIADTPKVTVTSRTTSGNSQFKGVEIDFVPSAVFCYRLGRTRIRRLEAEVL